MPLLFGVFPLLCAFIYVPRLPPSSFFVYRGFLRVDRGQVSVKLTPRIDPAGEPSYTRSASSTAIRRPTRRVAQTVEHPHHRALREGGGPPIMLIILGLSRV